MGAATVPVLLSMGVSGLAGGLRLSLLLRLPRLHF